IDTPGYDDEGSLGELRVRRTRQVLNKADVAVLVVDALAGMSEVERELTEIFEKKEIPYIIAYNKADLLRKIPEAGEHEIYISALKKTNIYELKERIAALSKGQGKEKRLVGDLVKANDFVVLVTPVDSAAPKGRLILPQQQT
ncbi:GTP-binding protein, partial [Parabacteroides distasonis]